MTAPAPTPAEQATIDRFGIFAEERVIEEVARALYEADPDVTLGDGAPVPWDAIGEEWREYHRTLATVNALPGLLAEVRRGRVLREAVEGLADQYERQGGYLRIEPIAADLRAALAPQADR